MFIWVLCVYLLIWCMHGLRTPLLLFEVGFYSLATPLISGLAQTPIY